MKRNRSPQQLPEGQDGKWEKIGAHTQRVRQHRALSSGSLCWVDFRSRARACPKWLWGGKWKKSQPWPPLPLSGSSVHLLYWPTQLDTQRPGRMMRPVQRGPMEKGGVTEKGRRRGAAQVCVHSRAVEQEKMNVKPCSVVFVFPTVRPHERNSSSKTRVRLRWILFSNIKRKTHLPKTGSMKWLEQKGWLAKTPINLAVANIQFIT